MLLANCGGTCLPFQHLMGRGRKDEAFKVNLGNLVKLEAHLNCIKPCQTTATNLEKPILNKHSGCQESVSFLKGI